MDKKIRYLFFDWGDTLMVDHPGYSGAMVTWPQITPMFGVIDLLPKLAEKYKCVVVSNAVESNAERMQQAFVKVQLDHYFHLFVTSKELGAKKPEIAFYQNAIQYLDADAERVMMIGNDYVKDIEPAKTAGLHTVFITGKAGDYPQADHVVSDFSKLAFLLS